MVALTKLGEGIIAGTIGLTVLSIGLNIYLILELRKLNRERILNFEEQLRRAEDRHALDREVIEVLSAIDRKVGTARRRET